MERVDMIIKGLFGIFGSIVSLMIGGLGLAFVVLLGLMAIDFITGLIVGCVLDGLNSSIGKKGLAKKTYIILLIGAVYLIQMIVPALNSIGHVGDGIAVAYCIIEFVSIVENGGKLGVPIGPLRHVIAILKPKDGGQV